MDLQQAIQEMVETKTFSLEGIKAVQQLRENFSKLTDEYAAKIVELNKVNVLNTSLFQENQDFKKNLEALEALTKSVSKREEAISRLEIEKACADKMTQHTLSMFNTVFANATLKNSVLREVAVPTTYGSQGTTSTSVVKEKLTEITERQVD
jgi:flagellar biosynthesis/type III secretory pathway chaperone